MDQKILAPFDFNSLLKINKNTFNEDNFNNLIYNTSCFDGMEYIPSKSIDVVITDPPYFILNKSNLKFKNRADFIQKIEFDEFKDLDYFLKFTKNWIEVVNLKMKDNSTFVCFFGMQYVSYLIDICRELNMDYGNIIIWHKTNPAPKIRKSGFLSSVECILYMTKGKPYFNFISQNKMHNFIETPRCGGKERLLDYSETTKRSTHPSLHPTQKPKEVISRLFDVFVDENHIILDPFAGTGVVNIIAKQRKNKSFGFDINEKYVYFANKKIRSTKIHDKKSI